jgi:hypothetical protein
MSHIRRGQGFLTVSARSGLGQRFSTYPWIYRERGALYLLSVGRFNPVDDPEGER